MSRIATNILIRQTGAYQLMWSHFRRRHAFEVLLPTSSQDWHQRSNNHIAMIKIHLGHHPRRMRIPCMTGVVTIALLMASHVWRHSFYSMLPPHIQQCTVRATHDPEPRVDISALERTRCPSGTARAMQRTPLVLTYNNLGHQDGAGAQLQRILGVWAVSRSLGLGFLASPLKRIGYQGLGALESNTEDSAIVQRWNDVFKLVDGESFGCNLEQADGCTHTFNISKPSLSEVSDIALGVCTDGPPRVLHITYAAGILDAQPDLLMHPAVQYHAQFPWLAERSEPPARRLRVAVHIRRGELYAVLGNRMLPNQYYVDVCGMISRTLTAMGCPHVFEIHTEQVARPVTITPRHHGMAGLLKANITLDPSQNQLQDFDGIHPKEMHINEHAIDTLQALGSAHVLVTSRSSFSYVAASLHDAVHGLVVYHPFWHKAPSSWFTMKGSTEDAIKNEAALARALADRVRCVR